MTAAGLLLHVLNFSAPALWMAGAAVLLGRLLLPAGGPRWTVRLAAGFAAGLCVLLAGLLWGGSDGRMATWACLAAVVAMVELCLRRGWRS